MRVFAFITVIALAILCPPVKADDPAIAKARAAASLKLMQRDRERDTIAAAKARASTLLKIANKDRECLDDVQAAIDRAASTGKQLFIWVGFDCKAEPEIRKAFPNAVHCHADAMNGDKTQRILAGHPTGRLYRFDRAGFDKGTPAVIRSVIETPTVPQRISFAPVQWGANCST